jgi:hypothetical protein
MGVRLSLVSSYVLQTFARIILTWTKSKGLALFVIFTIGPLAGAHTRPLLSST